MCEDVKFLIAISAYNRIEALKNLLNSLELIRYEGQVDLLISIDNSGTYEVNKLANDFNWDSGDKSVVIHKKKLGLKNHFIWIGDQTKKYDAVIFLEDDLFVSPDVINLAKILYINYVNDNNIAGCSLYNPTLCEFTGCRFYQIIDSYDTFFLQHPYWGNIWFRNQWEQFKKWYLSYKVDKKILPEKIFKWPETSFKKVFIQYLIENEKYIVYPRNSFVLNMGVKGTHNAFDLYQYRSVLQLEVSDFNCAPFSKSYSIYDAFFEIKSDILKKLNKDLSQYNFDVDLNGLRKNFENEYVLTTCRCHDYIYKYSNKMKPTEMNIVLNNEGNDVFFAKSKNVDKNISYSKRLFIDIDKHYYLSLGALFRLYSLFIMKTAYRIFRKINKKTLRKK